MAAPTLVRSAVRLVLALCAKAAITAARAEEGDPAGTERADDRPQSRHRVREELLDRPHELLSRGVEALSRDLDVVLGDPNRLCDSTGRTARLRAHITDFEGRPHRGPRPSQRETNGYRPVASLMLQIEVLFGDRYLQSP